MLFRGKVSYFSNSLCKGLNLSCESNAFQGNMMFIVHVAQKKRVLISLARVMLFRGHWTIKDGWKSINVLISLARVMLFRAMLVC